MQSIIQIEYNEDGSIKSLSINGKQVDLHRDIAYYDNGTRGWVAGDGKDFRLFLQEEAKDDEEE